VGWLALGVALLLVLLAGRSRERGVRAAGFGLAILLAVAGSLHMLTRPRAGWHLPGFGPRRWRAPE
jgi:hypothetical protein